LDDWRQALVSRSKSTKAEETNSRRTR
jgi:hypothetical protein